MSVHLADEAASRAWGERLASELRIGDVVLLRGELGAGKTSLARGVLAGLGWAGEVASPTFPLLVTYTPPDVRVPIAHADLYRLDRPDEVAELGLDDEVRGGVLLIEWPERLGENGWPGALDLALGKHGEGRRLTVSGGSGWRGRWPLR